jgi:hypothetical protein
MDEKFYSEWNINNASNLHKNILFINTKKLNHMMYHMKILHNQKIKM